jgi:hypothetical protein
LNQKLDYLSFAPEFSSKLVKKAHGSGCPGLWLRWFLALDLG